MIACNCMHLRPDLAHVNDNHSNVTIDMTLTVAVLLILIISMLQDIEAQDDDLELTLKMALEPDLRLRFFDAAQFSTWKRGLETLQQLLFSPG